MTAISEKRKNEREREGGGGDGENQLEQNRKVVRCLDLIDGQGLGSTDELRSRK
jgi:hypothetical protein